MQTSQPAVIISHCTSCIMITLLHVDDASLACSQPFELALIVPCLSVLTCHALSCLQAVSLVSCQQNDVALESHTQPDPANSLLQQHPELQRQQQFSYVKVQSYLHASPPPLNLDEVTPAPTPSQQISPSLLGVLLPPESISSFERASGVHAHPCNTGPDMPSCLPDLQQHVPGLGRHWSTFQPATTDRVLCKVDGPHQPSPVSLLNLTIPLHSRNSSPVHDNDSQELSAAVSKPCFLDSHNSTPAVPDQASHALSVTLPRPRFLATAGLALGIPDSISTQNSVHPQSLVPPLAAPLTFGDVPVDLFLHPYSAQLQLEYMQAPQNGHNPISNGGRPPPPPGRSASQPHTDASPNPMAASSTPQGPRSVFNRLGQTPPQPASNGSDHPPGFHAPGSLAAQPPAQDQEFPLGFVSPGPSSAQPSNQRSGMRSDQAPYSARSQDSHPRMDHRASSSSRPPPPGMDGPPGFAGVPAYLAHRLSPSPAQKSSGLPDQAAPDGPRAVGSSPQQNKSGDSAGVQNDSSDEAPPGFARAGSSSLSSRPMGESRVKGSSAGPQGPSASSSDNVPPGYGPSPQAGAQRTPPGYGAQPPRQPTGNSWGGNTNGNGAQANSSHGGMHVRSAATVCLAAEALRIVLRWPHVLCCMLLCHIVCACCHLFFVIYKYYAATAGSQAV